MKETHDGAYFKSQRIKTISRELAKRLNAGETILTASLLDWIEVSLGLSRKRAKQYIDLILKTHETWIEENDTIKREQSS